MLKEGEPIPEIFSDPAFGQSSHWELSTSQLSSPYLDGWGYGEGKFHMYISFTFVSSKTSLLQLYLTVMVFHIRLDLNLSDGRLRA